MLYVLLLAFLIILFFIYIKIDNLPDLNSNDNYQINENSRSNKNYESQLTELLQNDRIIKDYSDALAKGTSGIARPESLLSNSKQEISDAIKDYIRELVRQDKLTPNIHSPLTTAFLSLNQFIEDERLNSINKIQSKLTNNLTLTSDEQNEFQEFMQQFSSENLIEEWTQFESELNL